MVGKGLLSPAIQRELSVSLLPPTPSGTRIQLFSENPGEVSLDYIWDIGYVPRQDIVGAPPSACGGRGSIRRTRKVGGAFLKRVGDRAGEVAAWGHVKTHHLSGNADTVGPKGSDPEPC